MWAPDMRVLLQAGLIPTREADYAKNGCRRGGMPKGLPFGKMSICRVFPSNYHAALCCIID